MSDADTPTAKSRVVLVTGASSGIGQAIAGHLARAGHRVFGASRSVEPGSIVHGIEMIGLDVDDDASVIRGVEAVLQAAGRVDAVVNCAGWALMGAVEDTSVAEARAQIETNFFGVLRVCLAVLPAMRRQGGGHIDSRPTRKRTKPRRRRRSRSPPWSPMSSPIRIPGPATASACSASASSCRSRSSCPAASSRW